MANQAIALQARAPQGNFLAPAIQQSAQMINMMSQQRAAERQAAVAQQAMEIQRATEAREAAKAGLDTRKANQDYIVERVAYFRNQLPSVKDDASWNNWLDRVGKEDPEYAGELRRVSGGRYDPDYVNRVSMDAKTYIDKTIATPMATLQVGAGNKAFSTVVGGTNPGATPLTVAPARAAPAAPAVGAQPMAAPQTPTPAAGGMFQPISATGGQPQGEDPATAALAASLTKAQGTKQIDAGTVEQIKTMIQPELVDRFIQVNGIQVSPGGGMRSAVYRPGEDAAPRMQMVQAYNQPGSQFQVAKDPMQSPTPGSINVPLGRVAAEARAARAGEKEVYAIEKAKAMAARDAGPKPLTAVQEARLRTNIAKDYKTAESTIDAMTNPVSGVLAAVKAVRDLTPDQKEAMTGYSGYLPSVTGASKTADTKLKNLIGKVTALGKAQAALSGAIGPMAVQEWKIVRDLIADLEVTGMGAKDLDNQLDIIESAAQGAADRVRDTYLNQYAEEFERYPNRFQLKEPRGPAGANKPLRFNPVTGGFE